MMTKYWIMVEHSFVKQSTVLHQQRNLWADPSTEKPARKRKELKNRDLECKISATLWKIGEYRNTSEENVEMS